MLHAKNDAHISMSHFLFVVGGLEEGHKIWLQASQCAMKEGTTMQLWTSDYGDNRVMFCIAPEQFAEGTSVKEGIDGWFDDKKRQKMMKDFVAKVACAPTISMGFSDEED
jgi:hypothetical protein